ncbi:MAG: hypothetical protein ACLGIT_14415 [Gammaproteobacteria bacterium]|mgnify:CR=1 FL=1|uniref:hypothetical protein n=1 Tax=Azohydromonas sp. TaxID=1872666 RepID=UPI002CC04F29|nr:hypothetical protein [Azohydromonas sp.]HMM87295.1 hypothetical protein [Azohydromonas sp.]
MVINNLPKWLALWTGVALTLHLLAAAWSHHARGAGPAAGLWSSRATRMIHVVEDVTLGLVAVSFLLGLLAYVVGA